VPAVLPGKTVDVFLTTYNEDVPLLRGSIQSYLNFDYPCRIYVLDDGNRDEVRQLAESMGVNYITREDNLHAKAGNINNALEQTDGEFVIIFDADHVARSNFISRTIGYFEDPRVAFVQTPHAFYNFFNFSSFYDLKKRYYWEEGNLFYKCIQLGKHNDNAVIFCGSAAIFRRDAL
jgi:cellulose synthase/poly-beta-1,6-N-acetylglucosamine synthase-like glycosyltransferase